MTYDELVTKIRDYTEVDSNVFNSTIINGFIDDAEFRLLRDVDSDNNRKYATATVNTGNRFIDTPTDLLVIRSAQIIDGSDRTYMEPRDTSFMSEFNASGATGKPRYYAMWDEDTIVFAPTPDSAYTIQLNYILKPSSLVDNTSGTYLSQKFPNGLLYACLVEAFGYLKGPADMIQYYEGKYQQALQGFTIEQMGRRRRDEYQQGSPRLPKQS
ncbi:MAG: hypothetical protein VW915_02140 [Gammaproteobacteria bacterium]